MANRVREWPSEWPSFPPPLPNLEPTQVECRRCKAEPGIKCTRWRKTRRGLVKQVKHSPHSTRIGDARRATLAARVLITGEVPEQPSRIRGMECAGVWVVGELR